MIKKFYLFLLCSCSGLLANDASRNEYLSLIRTSPEIVTPRGNAAKGEIEIVLDPDKMLAIELATGRDVGVLKSDSYWIWINDACRFPDGREGVIGRILSKSLQRYPGAAVLPMLSDGKCVLNCEFRHSTRQWELEMPRGGLKRGESVEEAARREVREETGFVLDRLTRLGEVTGDSGVTGMLITIFKGSVTDALPPERESSEAINQVLKLSIPEIKAAFLRGYVECMIEGETKRVYARDPFLAYALTIISANQDIPKEMKSRANEYGFIHFYDEKDPFTEWLGNFYPLKIEYNGLIFLNSEAAYQAQKFIEYPEVMIDFTHFSGEEAFRMSRRLSNLIRNDWEKVKVQVMKEVLNAKVSQNSHIAEWLNSTEQGLLIEHNPVKGRDAFWSDDHDGSGQNWLGRLWMEIRAERRKI